MGTKRKERKQDGIEGNKWESRRRKIPTVLASDVGSAETFGCFSEHVTTFRKRKVWHSRRAV
jgi:hypothetical protein